MTYDHIITVLHTHLIVRGFLPRALWPITNKQTLQKWWYTKFTTDSDTALLQLCIFTALFMQPKIKIAKW